ncbi:MAG TPA: hypothetical protein VD995_15005 [Azospirillum sp.]|nr:hypothetical protein [Azospirillum sp.]
MNARTNATWWTGWRLTGVLLAAGGVYAVMLTVTLPALTARSGGLAMFDLSPLGYDAAYAHTVLERLGSEGRQYYLFRQLPLDAAYPALLALSLAGIWRFLLRWSNMETAGRCALAWCAVAVAGLDYAENIAVAAMLLRFPWEGEALVGLASATTVAKSMTATVCFVGVIGLAVAATVRRIALRR